MCDTHVKQYSYNCRYHDEYDMCVKVWHVVILISFSIIPIFNVAFFVFWLVGYVIHASWDPKNTTEYRDVYSLNGKNIFTKFLLLIKRILTKKINGNY